MTTSSSIDTLIDLASAESDAAAKKLGRAIRAGEEAAQKLSLLIQYRDDYAARFQTGMGTGLSAGEYRNYQNFIDKLDQAMAGQQLVVQEAQRAIGTARTAWQASERKRLSYDTLATRAQQQALQRDGRRDQKQTDELAARQAHAKR